MKTSYSNTFILIVSYLFIMLFTYALVSKVLDFQNFQIQLGQSPLLSAFAGTVAYGVIAVEMILVVMMMFKRSLLIALYGSLFLMTMFTVYICIILNFSSFIPCSCGGILEKMSWTQHLIFNCFFILLSLIAIVIKSKTKWAYGFIAIHIVAAASVVTVLFLLSEDIMQKRNNFVRRYPDKVHKIQDTDLKYNSFYFAGAAGNKLYLGNYTAPLLLTETDANLKNKKEIAVHIDNTALPFRSLELRVYPKYFFAVDGTVPCVFRGKTGGWKAKGIPITIKPFSVPVFTDSVTMAYRTHQKMESELGTVKLAGKSLGTINSGLLEKQMDGLFDVDGTLMFDTETKRIVYQYRYRNQYIVADEKLNLIARGKTIDTISKAQIRVAFNSDRNESKMSAPPLSVNKSAVAYNGFLFVNSGLIGKFEDTQLWKQSSIIDVYNSADNTYRESFYVYNIGGKTMSRFYVYQNNFYALIGTHLVSYRLTENLTKNN